MSEQAKKHLDIAHNLSLPIDAATQTFAFIGRKRSGKTYAAGRLVEGGRSALRASSELFD